MRNAKDSALNRYAVKNGTNRDGNEGVRKGLGCTNRSVRMDRLGMSGPHHPTTNKVLRQEPIFCFDQDGDEQSVSTDSVWLTLRAFDAYDGTDGDWQEYADPNAWAAEWESDRYFEDRAEFPDDDIFWTFDSLDGEPEVLAIPAIRHISLAELEASMDDVRHYSVQSNAYGDWHTAIGRISYSDANREADAMKAWAWYDVRIVRDSDGMVIRNIWLNDDNTIAA